MAFVRQQGYSENKSEHVKYLRREISNHQRR
jgi:hypothetical protein